MAQPYLKCMNINNFLYRTLPYLIYYGVKVDPMMACQVL